MKEMIWGKWNKNGYRIIKKIGEGRIGRVYEVYDPKNHIRALKLSDNLNSITREYYLMKELSGMEYLPTVYEIDDCLINDKIYSFFVMDYIHGENLKDIFLNRYVSIKEILGIGIIVLSLLEKVYDLGYIYGDLKLENIIIDKDNKRVALIDFGGMIGRADSIKEYTPTYYIKSWGIGPDSRDEDNMIFGVTMLMTSILLKKEFNPIEVSIDVVIQSIKRSKTDSNVKKVLIKGLTMAFREGQHFRHQLIESLRNQRNSRLEKSYKVDAIDNILIIAILMTVVSVIAIFRVL